jgi:hypothetical protein
MDSPEKKVISFFLDEETMSKLDALRAAPRRSRSSQIAFMVDEMYARQFPQNSNAPDQASTENSTEIKQ